MMGEGGVCEREIEGTSRAHCAKCTTARGAPSCAEKKASVSSPERAFFRAAWRFDGTAEMRNEDEEARGETSDLFLTLEK